MFATVPIGFLDEIVDELDEATPSDSCVVPHKNLTSKVESGTNLRAPPRRCTRQTATIIGVNEL